MNNKKIEFVSNTYKMIQNIIVLADNKAKISLSIQSLLVSIGLSTSILSKAFEKIENIDDPCLCWLFYGTVIFLIFFSLLGIILTIFAYKARGEKILEKAEGLLYFGDIIKLPTAKEYYAKISEIDENTLLKEYAHQIYAISKIADVKMKYINLSIYLLLVNLFLTITLILLSGYLQIVVGG